MAYQDRPYYRDGGSGLSNPLMWLLTGSVHLFTVARIRVRAHASLLLLMALILLFGVGDGGVSLRLQAAIILFGIVLLHEFGHCFAARAVGGDAEEVLLTPLGGLAMTLAPHRPRARFITVAGGPAVNVVICIVCGLVIYAVSGQVLLGPWQFSGAFPSPGWWQIYSYAYWIYAFSWALLLFNLLPVFPLDGGQLLQSLLWRPMGYYRSMIVSLNVGLVGAALMFMAGLAMLGRGGFSILLLFIAASCFLNCLQLRRQMVAEGPWGFSDADEPDYSASLRGDEPRPRRGGWLARRRARRLQATARREQQQQRRIDEILAKVSRLGMDSLTLSERRALRRQTDLQRRRDAAQPRRD